MAGQRPRAVRNLTAEFDAVPAAEPPPAVDGVPPGERVLAERVLAERVLAERVAAAERVRFAARWGYDVLLDKPIEGGRWEYELIHPRPPPSPQDAVQDAVQNAVQEAPREP